MVMLSYPQVLIRSEGETAMDATRRATQPPTTFAAFLLIAMTMASVSLQAQTISAHTWETPQTAPGTGQFFQCLYEQRWPCQPSAENAPTSDQILMRYEDALGGAAALGKVNTRIIMQRRFQDIGTPEDEYLL